MHKMVGNKLFFLFAFLMASIVALSNYLVQFPINYFNLEKFLTYGAFSYPIAFLITDLCNRRYGKASAKKIVYLGFFLGISLTLYFSINFSDLISIRIAFGSGTAFLVAQLIDVNIFDKLRKRKWYVAPLCSSIIAGSTIDTFLFFSISFYGTGKLGNFIFWRFDSKNISSFNYVNTFWFLTFYILKKFQTLKKKINAIVSFFFF